jgi:hypothetical protein
MKGVVAIRRAGRENLSAVRDPDDNEAASDAGGRRRPGRSGGLPPLRGGGAAFVGRLGGSLAWVTGRGA